MQCTLDNDMWVEVTCFFGADASRPFMLLYYFSFPRPLPQDLHAWNGGCPFHLDAEMKREWSRGSEPAVVLADVGKKQMSAVGSCCGLGSHTGAASLA